MKVDAPYAWTVEREIGRDVERPGAGQERYDYSLYGLHIRSDFCLPLGDIRAQSGALPDVYCLDGGPEEIAPAADGVVTCELQCHCPAHAGQVVMRVHYGPDRTRVWNDVAGICDIMRDGRAVIVYPARDRDPEHRMLAHLMTGIVSTMLMYQRFGMPSLHASGVVVDGQAAVFLGPKGQGKSTMAAAFLRRGADLLTDDLLPLRTMPDGIHGVPGVPLLKLWDESVEHALQYSGAHLPPVVPNFPKKFISTTACYPLASAPVRLTTLYMLDRYQPDDAHSADVTIVPLKSSSGLMSVLAQTPLRNYLPPKAFAGVLPLLTRLVNQASVRVVRFPSGYAFQDMLHERILTDLRSTQ